MKSLLLLIAILLTGSKPDHSPTPATIDQEHIKKEVVVFIYHRFGDDKYPSTNVSAAEFEAQLNYLKSNGFKVLSFGTALEYIHDPSIAYAGRVACITIDDAFRSFFMNGFPLLKKYGFPATLFVNSETIGGSAFMTWDELKTVMGGGIEIGNHTHSHGYFLDLPVPSRHQQFTADVTRCRDEIKEHLGIDPEIFAYPFGEFDNEMKAILKNLGFKGAAAQFSGVMYDNDDFAIPRFPMTGSTANLKSFSEKANIKALRAIMKTPDSPFYTSNPPSLTITFDTAGVDLSRINCFLSQGCQTEISGNAIKIIAKNPLTSRRTLYTITAPAKKGKGWYWFSHLWVMPNMKE